MHHPSHPAVSRRSNASLASTNVVDAKPADAPAATSKTVYAKSGVLGPMEQDFTVLFDATTQAQIAVEKRKALQDGDTRPHYLFLTDFDHTLSVEDSGERLATNLNIAAFRENCVLAAKQPGVLPGGELAYLLTHQGYGFENVTYQTLSREGRDVRLKRAVDTLFKTLSGIYKNARFSFFVVSAGPTPTIRAALQGKIAPTHVMGTHLSFADDGAIVGVKHVSAALGKINVLAALQKELNVADEHVIYMGDGSSDIAVMKYVRERGGFNVQIGDNACLKEISHARVDSDDLSCVLPHIDARLAQVAQR